MDDFAFKQMMIADESRSLKLYLDTRGKWTGGIGRNLTDSGFRDVEVNFMFANDLADTKRELNAAIPWWAGLSNNRQMVFANMAMNLGTPKFLGFTKMLAAARAGNFSETAAEILDSDAARELKDRYARLAELMEKG